MAGAAKYARMAGVAEHIGTAGAVRYVNAAEYAVPIGTAGVAGYDARGSPAGAIRQHASRAQGRRWDPIRPMAVAPGAEAP